MKKITLSILAFGAFVLTAQAQTSDVKSESKNIKFGLKGGLNLGNITNEDEAKVRASFHIGAVGEFFINEKFSIQPEFIYSRQGAKMSFTEEMSGDDGELNYEETLKLDYINIPVMAKYYIKNGLNVQAGPQIGINIGAEIESEYSYMGTTVKETESIKSEVSSVDLGFNLGIGYELPIGVFFDARYNFGLLSLNKDSFEGMGTNRNSVFQLSVGYRF